MAEETQAQNQQVSLSDFLLMQRRTMDQVIINYENNFTQFAQTVDRQEKEIQNLKAELGKKKESEG